MAKPERQLAMVMDLNKCIGCQTCTIACKRLWTRDEGMEYQWWNSVNTQPGRGTPRDWETMGGGFREGKAQPGRMPSAKDFGEAWNFNYDEVFFGGKGDKVHLEVQGEKPDWGPNWDEDQGAGEYPNAYYFYLPRICNHCTHPACLEACPRKAIVKRKEDGVVLIDEDRCRGYRFCMAACPYKKIYFNHSKRVSQKCIFCFPRIEQGVANACARRSERPSAIRGPRVAATATAPRPNGMPFTPSPWRSRTTLPSRFTVTSCATASTRSWRRARDVATCSSAPAATHPLVCGCAWKTNSDAAWRPRGDV